jgi:hypothetical protein
MRIRLEVQLPEDLFEEFFRGIRVFDNMHPDRNMNFTVMCDQTAAPAKDIADIFRRVMPDAETVVVPAPKDSN